MTDQAKQALLAGGVDVSHAYVASLSGPQFSVRKRVFDLPRPRRRANGVLALPSVLPETQLLPDLIAMHILKRAMNRERWDVCLVVGGGMVHGWAALGLDIPVVVWAATSIADERSAQMPHFRGARERWHRFALPRLERRERALLRRSAIVAAMSPYTARRLKAVAPRDVDVIEPCVREGIRTSPTLDGRAASLSHEIRLIYVGRILDPRKRFADALKVADSLARGAPDKVVRLAVTADESEVGQFLPSAGARVELLGHPAADELRAAVRASHWLVLTSQQEGFGLVVPEAFAEGTPVAVTPCGGPEEMVAESSAGVVSPADEMAEMILSKCSPDSWQGLSRRARTFAFPRFGFDRLSRELCASLKVATSPAGDGLDRHSSQPARPDR